MHLRAAASAAQDHVSRQCDDHHGGLSNSYCKAPSLGFEGRTQGENESNLLSTGLLNEKVS